MKKITTLMIALIAGLSGWAQLCDATFGSYNNPNTTDVSLYAYDSAQGGTFVWQTGDGTTITTLNGMANYTYNAPGTYYACLTVDDGMGCTDTYCDSVFVDSTGTPPPSCNADFYWWQAYDSLTSTYSSDVYLVNMATGSNLTYNWSFGDGTSSSQQYPTHTYPQIGSYSICLTVDNGNGCTNTFCDTISVLAKASGFTLNIISESQAATVGVEEENVVSYSTVYPNPVGATAILELNSLINMNLNISIFDISGKQISNETNSVFTGNNKIVIDTDLLTKGFYIMNLSSAEGDFTKTIRFAKQ